MPIRKNAVNRSGKQDLTAIRFYRIQPKQQPVKAKIHKKKDKMTCNIAFEIVYFTRNSVS